MLYFIPAISSPAEELKSLQERRRVIAVLLNYSIHTATTQSFLKNVFEIIIGVGTSHFYRCSIHINSIAGTPLTLTMINTGMWIQGRFLGRGRGRKSTGADAGAE
jgi:hypothetical protein